MGLGLWQRLTHAFQPPSWGVFDIVNVASVVDGMSAADLYRTQPHLRTVISFRAKNAAQLGLQVFQRVSDTDRQRVTDSVTHSLLTRPNPYMTQFELIESLVSDLDLYDAAFWIIAADRKCESGWRLQPVPPSWVSQKVGSDPFSVGEYIVTMPGGQRVSVGADNMVAFHGWNPSDRTVGSSAVVALRDVLSEQASAWKFRRQIWSRAGRVGSFLSRPKDAPKWDKDARNRFMRSWKSFQNDGARAGESPILEDGMELKRVGFSAREEQWLEASKLSLETVASAYHVNPAMVGALDNANYSNMQVFRQMLYTETLGPLLAFIQDRINTFLVPKVEKLGGTYVEFNIQAKLAGSFEEQAGIMSTAVGGPWMTRNEARARMNLPQIEGQDELITPLNVVTGGQASPQDGGKPSVAIQAALASGADVNDPAKEGK